MSKMDMFGRNSGREASEADPHPEWTDTGGEESMWSLGLPSRETFPERPGVPDCVYYLRTGFCGFGIRCRYNHPRAAATMAMKLSGGDYPERPGEPSCQYYLRTGTCKFGSTCKFHHPRNIGGSPSNVSLNYYGYPLRPGERECSYYLKTGQCKFGITCKFDHPHPASVSIPTSAPSFYPTVQSPSVHIPEPIGGASPSFSVPARPPLLPSSCLSGAYGPLLLSPGVVPVPGWTSYSAPVSPALSSGAPPSVGAASLYGATPLSTPTAAGPCSQLHSSAGQSSMNRKEAKFPERPGHPDCLYYLKTGDCKFGSSCRYHHPPERVASITCSLSPLGLPLRPGEQTCGFYMRNGFCRFGPTCKFDHPVASMKYSPSASSLTETPVVPYLTGPPIPSLPTSLSPDPSLEYCLDSGSDPYSGRISS